MLVKKIMQHKECLQAQEKYPGALSALVSFGVHA